MFLAAALTAATVADIEIKAARLDYARPANTFGYSAIVANNGPESAQGVEVVVLLPPGATLRNAEPCVGAGSLVRCAIGTLAPGEERRVFMLVLTREMKPRVTAFAVSETADTNASNNTREATTP